MSGGYTPEAGHRVRVVLEGVTTATTAGRFGIGPGRGWTLINANAPHVVSVERLPDPEPDWKEGDVVLDADGGVLSRVAKGDLPWLDCEDGARLSHNYPGRPLTLLVRAGKAVTP